MGAEKPEEQAGVESAGDKNAEDEARMQKPFLTRLNDDIDALHFEGKVTVNGKSFITHLVSTYWGVRGFPENILDITLMVLATKTLGLESSQATVLNSLAFTPWAMKPLFAITSDIFGFLYYKKRWYMVTFSGLAALACFVGYSSSREALLGANGKATLTLMIFGGAQAAIALCDSLSQGKYTEICKWKGATVVSFVSASKIMAGVLAALVGPVFNDTIGPQFNLLLVIPLFAQAAVVQGCNFMGDKRLPQPCLVDKEMWTKDSKIIITGLVLGGSAALLVVMGLLDLDDFLLPTAIAAVIIILAMTFWSLPKKIALINVYIIFCRVAALDVRIVLQQWYTALSNQCQGTPHFPNTIYQMVGLFLGNTMTLVGIWLFENYVAFWDARKAFWVTTVFTMVAALFDISMLTGFNRTMWGWVPFMGTRVSWFCTDTSCEPEGYRLDDLFGFLIGMQALKPIATTLDEMPSTVLLSKLCPAGVETTVFAMLAALMNLGLTVSGLMAGIVLKANGVNISRQTVDEVDVYSCELGEGPFGMTGIVWTLVLGGIILPATTIPATFFLIPSQSLNDKFVEDTPAEVELVATPPHPAAAFGRQSPSFAGLADPTISAPPGDLEKAASLMFRKSTTNMLGGSRML